MHGEIIIADLLAAEAARKRKAGGDTRLPTTPQPAQELQRDAEWIEDWNCRQHLRLLHRAYEEFGAANHIEREDVREAELAKVRKRWGTTLDEALERMSKHRKWLKREYMPRVAAWHQRMGNRPAV
jgi:hypothetical protein